MSFPLKWKLTQFTFLSIFVLNFCNQKFLLKREKRENLEPRKSCFKCHLSACWNENSCAGFLMIFYLRANLGLRTIAVTARTSNSLTLCFYQNTYCVQLCKQSNVQQQQTARVRILCSHLIIFMKSYALLFKQKSVGEGIKVKLNPTNKFYWSLPFALSVNCIRCSITTLCTLGQRNFIVWLLSNSNAFHH